MKRVHGLQEGRQPLKVMIVSDFPAQLLPEIFLGVQLGGVRRQPLDLDLVMMSFQELAALPLISQPLRRVSKKAHRLHWRSLYMAAHTIEQLRALTMEQLVLEHDRIAPRTELGISYYLNEIARRELDKQSKDMLLFTKQIGRMTGIITVATLINLVVAIAFYYK